MTTTLNHNENLTPVFEGRKITDAATETDKYGITTGTLTLDDGTTVRVIPNDGGCSCGAGDYTLTELVTVDNIITRAEVVDENKSADDFEDTAHVYRLFVYAEDKRYQVAAIEGDDGNGYYGTGFELVVEAGR